MGSGNRGFGIGRISAALAVCTAALALVAPGGASAAGNTYYAAEGTHTAAPCTQAAPCEISDAIAKAQSGDSVLIAAGEYTVPFTGLEITKAISFGGLPGERPLLKTGVTPANLQVTPKAGAELHDLRLEGQGRLLLESGSAERVFVDSTATDLVPDKSGACSLSGAILLRDSVCWSHEEGGGNGKSPTDAVSLNFAEAGIHSTAVLRNVTAVAASGHGNGIVVEGFNGSDYTVDARNVIAHSDHGVDAIARSDAKAIVLTKLHVNISNSSFASVEKEAGYTDLTSPDTAGNSTAPPLFLDAAAGDFHEAEGSPTVDLGAVDGFLGASDLDGSPRSQPGCLGEGARVLPDAGAFERRATANCPPPPPPQPIPPQPRMPVFRVLKLTLAKGSGRGSVTMEVPGPGIASVTGSGVKFVTRKVSAAGTVTLPILPWAISRVRLAKNGKLKVRLKLGFEASAGGTTSFSRRVTLRKSIR